jgi:hypothetical protein
VKLCGSCLAEWGALDICCPQCHAAKSITLSEALRLLNGSAKALHLRTLDLEKREAENRRVLTDVGNVMAKVKKLLGSDGMVKLE